MSSTISTTGPDSKQGQRKAAMTVLAHSAAADIAGRLAAIAVPAHENKAEEREANIRVHLTGQSGLRPLTRAGDAGHWAAQGLSR